MTPLLFWRRIKKNFIVESKKINIIFEGNNIDRVLFLEHFRDKVLRFFGMEDGVRVYMFSKEMIKNIFDHAGGRGESTFEKSENFVLFEVKDYGEGKYDFQELKSRGTSKPESGNNFGVGLTSVESMNEMSGVEIKINTEKGFSYSGKFPLIY